MVKDFKGGCKMGVTGFYTLCVGRPVADGNSQRDHVSQLRNKAHHFTLTVGLRPEN
jgi:hypothetical protein